MPGITTVKPLSDYKARLMQFAENAWEMVCPIAGTPQIGGEPEMLDVSTNEDKMEKKIAGRQTQQNTSVKTYYDADLYTALTALENKTLKLALWVGNEGNGEAGCWEFEGQITPVKDATEGNNPLSVTIYIMITGEVVFKAEPDNAAAAQEG